MNHLIQVAVFHGLIACGFCQVLFEKDFSETIPSDPAKVQVRPGSLDFKFHRETGNRLWVKNNTAGVVYQLDPNVSNPAAQQTLYLSFILQSFNTTTKDKFAGIVLYRNNQEVFGLGNDYVSENFSFWGSDGKGVVIGDIPTAVDADVHKIVMRIDYNPNGEETIKVGLDPF